MSSIRKSSGLTSKSGAAVRKPISTTTSKTSGISYGSTSKSSSSKVSSKAPTFGTSKPAGAFAPTTSKKTSASFTPRSGKSSFGIIWIPTRKTKHKDVVYNSINFDKKRERSPSMYNYMSGDSSELHKKKDEEASLLVPERLKGPIATVASAGTAATIAEAPSEIADFEDKLLKHVKTDESNVYQKEAAGDANDTEDEYLENKDAFQSNLEEKKNKSVDNVDSVYVPQPAIKVPPRSTASNPEEEDCGIKCLYYTLQCCDCNLM